MPAEARGGVRGWFDRTKVRATLRLATARHKHPLLDHAVSAAQHFGTVKSTLLAGAVTYFGLLSFFPIIALVFAVLGYIVRYTSADVKDTVVSALQDVLPGIFAELDVDAIERAAATASLIGVVGFLYSGLGWVSSMRSALETVFDVPKRATRSMLVGKAFDLVVLCAIGLVLVVSVAASSVVTAAATSIAEAAGVSHVAGFSILLRVGGIVIGVLASTVLFFVILRVLPKSDRPARALWEGAFVAAIGFEVLKLLATYVIAATANNPVYGPFAIVVALLVWINYFARLVMLGACWAATGRHKSSPTDATVADDANDLASSATDSENSVATQAEPGDARRASEPLTEPASTAQSAASARGDVRTAVATALVVGAAAIGVAELGRRARRDRAGASD
jgi:membrane protein